MANRQSSAASDDLHNPQPGAMPDHAVNPPRPVSYISTHMTDIASEDGDTSRPPTAISSQPAWSQPPASRRGPPPTRNSMTATNQGTSRPPSSSSRMSRTHIPSLTAHGFFRPMSSQRLQAQRSGRPINTPKHHGPPTSTEDGMSDVGTQKRRSLLSNHTILYGGPSSHENELPPPSRGTEFTDPVITDRGTSNASPTGNTTVRSLGESVRLLHDRPQMATPSNLNLGKNYNKPSSPQDNAQKSPMSFGSGFLMPGKNDGPDRRDSRNHERLSSAASTPCSVLQKGFKAENKPNLGKNYEYFAGNTVFCGGGRFQNSRDKPVNIATGIIVVLPAALFFGYSAPWLWRNASPAIPIIFAYLFLLCFSSFIHASVVDPGIFPRNLHPMPPVDPNEDPLTPGPPSNDWVMTKLATSDVAAMDVPVKYCRTCNIWRPPRCYHCRVCDNCVETLDHHCVWLNNCVGRRNYRYFFTFVSSGTILSFFLMGASLGHCLGYRNQEGISFSEAISKCRVPFAMFLYGLLAAPYPASLWAYHFLLMGRGETTREYLNSHKFPKEDRHRPFTQGNILRNWIAVLLRPRPPTYAQFKRRYEEGDQRFEAEKRKYRARDLEAQTGEGMEMQGVPNGPASNK
ncbi:palmitoyltransferase erf2 [Histoplasma capsulatum var. duboisii H88]|uniref:Palmitoyltransferase n=1 Tax=Ajellomyces capsulatus (strain H88) TaxID=544711 RepID=A0A8A1LJH5_AJEC8|nr:palmitoyltransferase erf2 [Histoplasma capsulatum var. duboisii H88]